MKNLINFNENVYIETASQSDIGLIADIHANSFPTMWSADEIAALLSQDHVVSLIARKSNIIQQRKILGFVICRKAADEAEILTIAVEPRQRRKGFGRMLVDELIRQLYRDGIKKLFLEVDDQSTGAVKLYKNVGFKKIGTRENYYTQIGSNSCKALTMKYDIK